MNGIPEAKMLDAAQNANRTTGTVNQTRLEKKINRTCKKCAMCLGIFPNENFTKGDAYCKQCRTEYSKLWRVKNYEYNKERKKLYKKNKIKSAEYEKTYRKNNPIKMSARRKVQDKIRNGLIIRPHKCEKCGVSCKPHGHHCNYEKPLDIMWLCCECHAKEHWQKTPDVKTLEEK